MASAVLAEAPPAAEVQVAQEAPAAEVGEALAAEVQVAEVARAAAGAVAPDAPGQLAEEMEAWDGHTCNEHERAQHRNAD